MQIKIPDYVFEIINSLEKAGHEAYIVGGCVRDLLLMEKPNDWDITTNAKPDEILEIFQNSKYENKFGTVLVSIDGQNKPVEITTYRSESKYSDKRHPDIVEFVDSLEKDLSRRDFTINAMAIKLKNRNKELKDSDYEIIDLFGGQKDLKRKIIRAVREPLDRFKEDALRMLRAIRFATELSFKIEPRTERAIKKMAGAIKFIANERIRDEFIKILKTEQSYKGILLLNKTKLLQYIIPELTNGIGVRQNRHHIYTVFKHNLLTLKYCPSKDWRVRLSALLHDVAKPQTKRGQGYNATFYNHDIIGAKIATKIMTRLKFSNKDIEKVSILIRNHMFYYNVGEVTEAAVRRLIRKVGKENMKDLIDLRIADRLGSGVPKAKPYKLRHLEYLIKKVSQDPLSVKKLNINGKEIMEIIKIKPGPKIGAILDVLLSEVIENPKLNNSEYLKKRTMELNKLNLNNLRKRAKEKIQEKKMEDDKILKKEFWVK